MFRVCITLIFLLLSDRHIRLQKRCHTLYCLLQPCVANFLKLVHAANLTHNCSSMSSLTFCFVISLATLRIPSSFSRFLQHAGGRGSIAAILCPWMQAPATTQCQELQKSRAAEVKSFRGQEFPGPRASCVKTFLGKNFLSQEILGQELPGSRGSWVKSFLGQDLPGSRGSYCQWLRGARYSWVKSFLYLELTGSGACWVKSFLCLELTGSRASCV